MANKIRKGDTIIVIAGRDKGRKGTVIEVRDDDTLIVESVNRVKKHQKGNPQAGVPAAIVEKEAPLHVSKVAILNPATQKADRVGFKTLADGKKVRFFKSNGEMLEV
jgi:large subunit ribosomal protein L24